MNSFFADLQIEHPVALAPLAGVTDRPFRELVAGFGAAWTVSEMVASQDFIHQKPSVRARAELCGTRTAIQIAGRDEALMGDAARMAEDLGARVIDINMGCPAKKVTRGQGAGACGAALLKEPDLALRLIEAVVAAVSVPVTLKTRLGWDQDRTAPALARAAEGAGIRAITIHGRTRTQFYKGQANWAAIAEVKDAVRIPVMANGDILDSESAKTALAQSGADGVMVGRGAQGRPWVLAQIAHDLFGAKAPKRPEGKGFCDMVIGHYEAMLSFYGTALGSRVARKHLGWYMDRAGTGAGTGAGLRRDILTATDPNQVKRLLPEALILPQKESAA